MQTDEELMGRALWLAEESVGLASPNPQVGCVLVRDGKILGEGAHHFDAFDHAEIVALKRARAAGEDARGATAYVTLEPCSHHGRTGPCADALIAAGVARCVVATVDPNPAVAGRGLARLRNAGVKVHVGLLEARARAVNNAFAVSITQHRPFVTLKAALSVDGMLAPAPLSRKAAEPFWLTGPKARAEVHRLRHASDVILTGIGTVLADDPLLTDRSGMPRRRPLERVVLDTHLRIPLSAKLVQSAQGDLWIFCGFDVQAAKILALETAGVRVTQVENLTASLNLAEILTHLHEARFLSVLLEAGSNLNGAFLRQRLVDRAILFYAETELGPDAIPFANGSAGPFVLEQTFLSVDKRPFGADICVSGLLQNPWPPALNFS